MTRNQILDVLSNMPQGQFDVVLAKIGVPHSYLSGSQAAQGTRATEFLRYVEQQGRLAELSALLRVAPAPTADGGLRRSRALLIVAGIALLAMGGLVRWMRPRHPPEGGVKLIWSPSDCGRTEPRIGYGSCQETRELPLSDVNYYCRSTTTIFAGLSHVLSRPSAPIFTAL